jgi:hypothetical protein
MGFFIILRALGDWLLYLAIHLQRGDEGFLRDVDLAELPHPIPLPSALPRRSDRRPAPARTETATIVASAEKSGPTEIVPLAVVAEILRGIVRLACDCSLPAIDGDGIVWRLMIAGEEAVAVPMIGVSLLSGCA